MFPHPIFKNPSHPPSPPLRFPQKLWKIANECQSGAVFWSPDGKSILLRYSLFREEFMNAKNDLFKTHNISSFVRQLNLYGFRKVYDYVHKQAYKASSDLHEFSNTYFQKDRPDLLDKVSRKPGILKDKCNLEPDFLKSTDLSDESSCERQEGMVTSIDTNDHSYMSTQKNESPNELLTLLEEKAISIAVAIQDSEKLPETPANTIKKKQLIQEPQNQDNSTENIPPILPVKKKRGRKPGSKRKKLPVFFSDAKPQNYFSPVLKNPGRFPELLYFDDDDDSVFLRNTSRDVMLSSTLPFQETPEYLELKDTYMRLYDMKRKAIYEYTRSPFQPNFTLQNHRYF